jgi:hypothetical protein
MRMHVTQYTPDEQDAMWEHAARTAADATHRIRLPAGADPAAAADAAWAADDVLRVAAAALNSHPLRQAAAAYDRAARAPFGRIPTPPGPGTTCATPPVTCPPSRPPPATQPSPRSPSSSASPRSLRASPPFGRPSAIPAGHRRVLGRLSSTRRANCLCPTPRAPATTTSQARHPGQPGLPPATPPPGHRHPPSEPTCPCSASPTPPP